MKNTLNHNIYHNFKYTYNIILVIMKKVNDNSNISLAKLMSREKYDINNIVEGYKWKESNVKNIILVEVLVEVSLRLSSLFG